MTYCLFPLLNEMWTESITACLIKSIETLKKKIYESSKLLNAVFIVIKDKFLASN